MGVQETQLIVKRCMFYSFCRKKHEGFPIHDSRGLSSTWYLFPCPGSILLTKEHRICWLWQDPASGKDLTWVCFVGGQGEPCHLFGEYCSDSRPQSGLPPTLYTWIFLDVLNHWYGSTYPKTKLANLTHIASWLGVPIGCAIRSPVPLPVWHVWFSGCDRAEELESPRLATVSSILHD